MNSLLCIPYHRKVARRLGAGTWCALVLFTATFAHAAESAASKLEVGPWEKGTSPQEIGKRVAERFVASPHPNFGRPTPARYITYPETCAWYGALTFAKASGDKELTAKLIKRFEPLFGEESKLVPKPSNVDSTVFGSVPLEIYLQTNEKKYLDLGLSFADKQWETPEGAAREKLKPEVRGWVDKGLSWHTRFWIDDML